MTPPRCEKATILLCDDIREEADGRQSLIGVHGPTLKVARLPYTHRGLSVFVQIVNPADAFPGVQFELIAPDGSVVAEGAGETPGASVSPGTSSVHSNYRIHLFPIRLALPGAYVARVWFDRAADVGVEAQLMVTVDPPAVL